MSSLTALDMQKLCQEIFTLGETLACTLVDEKGKVLATRSSGLGEDREFKSRLGDLVAIIWGGIRGSIHIGGQLKMFVIVFEEFQSIAIPVESLGFVILVTVPVWIDCHELRNRIINYARYFGH